MDEREKAFRNWACDAPAGCTIARAWDAAWDYQEKEIQRLQSLIDEHNRAMDAECETGMPACYGAPRTYKDCHQCPRRHRIEGK